MTIALIALIHSEFEWLKSFSHNLYFEYVGSIMWRLLSRSSRKFLPLLSKAWNVIFHRFMISSHSFFWLKSYKDLHGRSSNRLNLLISLSTISWSNHLSWLGQSQKLIELWWLLSRNSLISLEMTEVWTWYRWINESKIFSATCMESVMIMMCSILDSWIAWFNPHLIVNNLASVDVMLTVR